MDVRDNINRVIEALKMEEIEGEHIRFDMEHWFERHTHCGTAACIGGFAQLVLGMKDKSDAVTAKHLGLNYEERFDLFYPSYYPRNKRHSMRTTREQAIALLEDIRDGEAARDAIGYHLPERVRA